MNRNKWYIRLTASLLSVMVFLAGCAKQNALTEERQQLADAWEGYLAATDEIYGNLYRAFDAAEIFVEDNRWDSLLKARVICADAMEQIRNIPPLEFPISDEQYETMLNAGIEADMVLLEYGAFEGERELALNTLGNLSTKLHHDIFLTANVEAIPLWLECNREIFADVSKYLCLNTNYLLLQLDGSDLWKRLPETYPNIGAYCAPWSENEDYLMAEGIAALDRYAGRFETMDAITGMGEYTLEIIKETIETGDYTRLAAQMHKISGVPGYLITPFWLPEQPVYQYESGDRELPEECRIVCGGVAWENVESYIANLQLWGLEPKIAGTENDPVRQVLLWHGESIMEIVWTEEETTITLVEPVGCLIPEMYLVALLYAGAAD